MPPNKDLSELLREFQCTLRRCCPCLQGVTQADQVWGPAEKVETYDNNKRYNITGMQNDAVIGRLR